MAVVTGLHNLNNRWEEIKAHQGVLGKAWNEFKEATNLGQSVSDCESMLEKYKNHEITLDEAMEYINSFDEKQSDMTNLISNIATGVASIAIATTAMFATGGASIGWGLAMLKGAPIGAVIKTGLKTLDRATNDVEGDALDKKEIIKDVVSGAVTGTTSAVSSHIFAGVKAAKLSTSIINGTKCGLVCGAMSGSANYLTDTALDENKEFNFDELAQNAATSALVSGSVGAFVGGGVYGVENMLGNVGKDVTSSLSHTITRDSFLSSSRKVLGNAERQAFSS